MNRIPTILAGTLLAAGLAPWPAPAAELAQVVALQPPAWLQRGAYRFPLQPGTAFHSGDTVAVGDAGHVTVRTADGGLLRLAPSSQLLIHDLRAAAAEQPFSARLELDSGQLRYTTISTLRELPRQLDVVLDGLTIHITHTDIVFARQGNIARACLIDGEAAMDTADAGAQPLPRGGCIASDPAVDNTNATGIIDALDTATRMPTGKGTLVPDGGWNAYLASFTTLNAALALSKQFQDDGYPTTHITAHVNNVMHYRVYVPDLESKQEATGLLARLKGRHGIRTPWIDYNGERAGK
jgi:hypothetical protein